MRAHKTNATGGPERFNDANDLPEGCDLFASRGCLRCKGVWLGKRTKHVVVKPVEGVHSRPLLRVSDRFLHRQGKFRLSHGSQFNNQPSVHIRVPQRRSSTHAAACSLPADSLC